MLLTDERRPTGAVNGTVLQQSALRDLQINIKEINKKKTKKKKQNQNVLTQVVKSVLIFLHFKLN